MIEQLVHGQESTAPVDQIFHLHKPELIEPIGPYIHGMLVLDENLCQPRIESSRRGYMFSVLVAFEDVDVGSDCVFEWKVHHFANPHRTRPTDQAHKASIDPEVIEQADCDLKGGAGGSLLLLVSRDFVTISSERTDSCCQLCKVVIVEDGIVTGRYDMVDEFGVEHPGES